MRRFSDIKGRRISDRSVVEAECARQRQGRNFTEFEHDGFDAHVLGKWNVYDHLEAGFHDINCRFIVVRPYLIVYTRVSELGRVLTFGPWFDEFFRLFWNGEIQSMHAVIGWTINTRLGTLCRLTCLDLCSRTGLNALHCSALSRLNLSLGLTCSS